MGPLSFLKEAQVNKTPFDLIPYLQGIEAIKASSLSMDQKAKILAEMIPALPAPVFCKSCPETLAIIGSLLEVKDAKATKATKEIPTQGTTVPPESTQGRRQLLLEADADRGGPCPTARVVNKKTHKRGASTRNP